MPPLLLDQCARRVEKLPPAGGPPLENCAVGKPPGVLEPLLLVESHGPIKALLGGSCIGFNHGNQRTESQGLHACAAELAANAACN